jgi:UDP-N-acetylglucosamine 2-epimerase
MDVSLARVEAGLHRLDITVPEYISHKLTNAASRLLFPAEQSRVENPTHEASSAQDISASPS